MFFLYKPWKHTSEVELRVSPHIHNLDNRWPWVINIAPRQNYSGTHWIEGWVGPKTSIDFWRTKKILLFPGFQSQAAQSVAYLLHRLRYLGCWMTRIMKWKQWKEADGTQTTITFRFHVDGWSKTTGFETSLKPRHWSQIARQLISSHEDFLGYILSVKFYL
jgi:hypothetical protein